MSTMDTPRLFLSTLSLRRATKLRCTPAHIQSFLSTLSLRRATCRYRPICGQRSNFYPRSPCGERPIPFQSASRPLIISIHALLAESDNRILVNRPIKPRHFYPRSPCGERHEEYWDNWQGWHISIHALLAESDFPFPGLCL